MSNVQLGLTCLATIVTLAIYWTLWKIRNDLMEGRQSLKSDLAEVRKLLEGKSDK